MVIHLLYYVLQQRVTHLFLNDSQSCTDDLLWEVTNKCIYRNVDLYIMISLASYKFRPPIMAIFKEVC